MTEGTTGIAPTPPEELAPVNWPVALVLGLTFLAAVTIVPWYGFVYGYTAWAWGLFGVFLIFNGIGIGSGYHRLWSHRAYQAHPALKAFLAVFGGMAIQNSILIWCARHRLHHRDVDDPENDPYSIRRGFWFAHVGWMLRDYRSGEVDYSVVPDLQRDPIVSWQHRWYLPLILITNIGLPLLLGLLVGDPVGVFLLAGVLRLVVSHHVTFFINSLAHMWGKQPYSDENSARDNWIISLVTYGEGYHNYHHMFQNDYRNGHRWWHFDMNKWFISLCAMFGLARDLTRAPQFKILRARLNMEFKHAHEKVAACPVPARWRDQLEHEYAEFMETVRQWQQLQIERVQLGRRKLARKIENNALTTRYRELERSLSMQRKRVALLLAQVSI